MTAGRPLPRRDQIMPQKQPEARQPEQPALLTPARASKPERGVDHPTLTNMGIVRPGRARPGTEQDLFKRPQGPDEV